MPTALTDDILKKAKEKGFEAKDEAELNETLADLRFMLKALIAYNAWDRSEYFKIINTRSDIVKRRLSSSSLSVKVLSFGPYRLKAYL